MKRFFLTLSGILLLAVCSQGQILQPQVDSIPMRDGQQLAADVYLPSVGGPYSTVLVQTPYNRLAYRINGVPLFGTDIDSMPYAVVIVDWRCFFGSTAACGGNATQGEDGYDVIDWIVDQPWSDGKVGTWGPSALGRVQYATAREQHPNHTCAIPLVAAPQYNYQEYLPGGAARTEYLEQLDQLGFGLSNFVYSNTHYNNFWAFAENDNFYPDAIQIPMLMIGGWYDHNVLVMTDFFEGLQMQSDTAVRDEHVLLMGPWAHGGNGSAKVGTSNQGQLDFPLAAGWSDSLALQFFEYYLQEVNNGWAQNPEVFYYQMGNHQWRSASSWPPANMSDTLFLHDDGTLQNGPDDMAVATTFQYDPRDPSPTIGGPTLRNDLDQGPFDQAPLVESRGDAVIFSTGVLANDITVTGRIRVNLFVSSDRPDSDLCVRLTNVYPDGRSMLLADGIQRMRFRNGYTANDTLAMQPGEVYPITITLPDMAHTFKAGHQLRLIVTSSNYPRFDANLNSYQTMYQAGDTLVATNSIHHQPPFASNIVLPTPLTTSVTRTVTSPDMKLNVFPNPAQDQVMIQWIAKNMPDPELRLMSTSGTVLKTVSLNSMVGNYSLDISQLPAGIYILALHSPRGSQRTKLVVMH